MNTQWCKCASVTTGGKPFFWFKNGVQRRWILWNRQLKHWELLTETINGADYVIASATTDKALLKQG